MAVVDDLRRRFGVGWPGVLLYLALSLGGIGLAEWFGTVPTAPASRYPPLRTTVPAVVFLFGLLGVTLAASNFPTYVRLRRSNAAGTGSVGRSSGRVALEGTVDAGEGTLRPPVSRTEAVAYTTRVLRNAWDDASEARESAKNWSAVHVGERVTRFGLDDGTGPVPVDPDDARLYLQGSEERFVEAGSEVPSTVRAHLDDADVDVDPSGAHLRVEATTLEPGESAVVVGRAEGDVVRATLVAEGDHAARVRDRVVTGGGVGAVVAAAGYLGLLVVSGVL